MSSGNLFKAHPEQDTISAVCMLCCLRYVISVFVAVVAMLLPPVAASTSFIAFPCENGRNNKYTYTNLSKETYTNLMIQFSSIVGSLALVELPSFIFLMRRFFRNNTHRCCICINYKYVSISVYTLQCQKSTTISGIPSLSIWRIILTAATTKLLLLLSKIILYYVRA